MDGSNTLIQNLANRLTKPRISQENNSDSFININSSIISDATATINTSPILNSSNSPVLPESQPVNLEGITLIWYDLRLDTTEDSSRITRSE